MALMPRCFGTLGDQELPCIGGLSTFGALCASGPQCFGTLVTYSQRLSASTPLAIKSCTASVASVPSVPSVPHCRGACDPEPRYSIPSVPSVLSVSPVPLHSMP
ncbi:UNVERIFIED_CONTAM: hypothetical protein FKN15_047542 [Acipenser sinensis]